MRKFDAQHIVPICSRSQQHESINRKMRSLLSGFTKLRPLVDAMDMEPVLVIDIRLVGVDDLSEKEKQEWEKQVRISEQPRE